MRPLKLCNTWREDSFIYLHTCTCTLKKWTCLCTTTVMLRWGELIFFQSIVARHNKIKTLFASANCALHPIWNHDSELLTTLTTELLYWVWNSKISDINLWCSDLSPERRSAPGWSWCGFFAASSSAASEAGSPPNPPSLPAPLPHLCHPSAG